MPEDSANNNQTPAQVIMRFWHRRSAYQKWGAVAAVALALIVLVFGYKDTAEMTAGARLIRDIIVFCLAVIGIAMAAWRNYSLDRQSKAANEQAKLASNRLYSDQFANAVELMAKETTGEKPKPAIASRIGGIYIMANLAMQLPTEFAEQVVINLIAYIKHNAQETTKDKPSHPQWRMLGDDVKAAFSVLSDILGSKAIRIHIGEGGEKALDFSYHDFHGLNFWQIDLRHYPKWMGTNFRDCYMDRVRFADGANMQGANFYGASLREAIMKGANLQWANMQGADLTGADMQGCFMRNAMLYRADDGKETIMERAKLTGADMKRVKLMEADMRKADLRGAVLDGANLTGVKWLVEAIFGETSMLEIADKKAANKVKDDLSLRAQSENVWFDNPDDEKPINWRLEQYDDGYALAGVLINYADAPAIHKEETRPMLPHLCLPGEPENIRQQAARLKKLPENTPDSIKEWLKGIRAKYSGR